jgi:hypothetical protein
MTKLARPLLHAAAVALLAGCAAAPPHEPSTAPAAVADAPFALDGRLAARRGGDAVSASFTWHHAPPRDDLVVTTPLGQAFAEISGDTNAQRVEMRMADAAAQTRPTGRRSPSRHWASAADRGSRRVRGRPHAGAPHWVRLMPRDARRTAAGRVGNRL